MIPTDEITHLWQAAGGYTLPVSRDRADFIITADDLPRFAKLVSTRAAAIEREACAKVCAEIQDSRWAEYKGRAPFTKNNPNRGNTYTEGASDGASDCIFAIRALGDQHEQ